METNHQSPITNHSIVTAIIVSYESAAVLKQCLESLAAQGVQAIVVDNASRDSSADIAKTLGAKVIINEKNEGFGRANNIGVNAATSEFCLLINPDTTLDAGCIAHLLNAASQTPDFGILAPQIVEPDGRVFFQAKSRLSNFLPNISGALHLPEGDCCTPFVSGACMLVKRETFLNMGGFDPAIFLFYEDDDLCRRVSDAGRSIIYVHDAVIRHLRGKSVTPSLKHTYTVRYHQAFSRAYVCTKYGIAHPALKLCLISLGKLLFALLTFKKQKIMRHLGSFKGNLDVFFIRHSHE